MSSILKALKKLEEEKTSPRSGNADIARAVLAGAHRNEGRPVWVFPVSLAGAALGAALLTYLLAGKTVSPARDASPPTETSRVAEGEAGKVESTHFPQISPNIDRDREILTGPAIQPPVRGPKNIVSTGSGKKAARSLPSGPDESIQRLKNIELRASEEPASGLPANTALEPAPAQRPAPAIKVSGIAWQKDGADRIAVVNGIPVSEGMTVSGVRVEQIFPEKVRFSFEKRTFEVGVGRDSP
jgi:general secretion pathway protein B